MAECRVALATVLAALFNPSRSCASPPVQEYYYRMITHNMTVDEVEDEVHVVASAFPRRVLLPPLPSQIQYYNYTSVIMDSHVPQRSDFDVKTVKRLEKVLSEAVQTSRVAVERHVNDTREDLSPEMMKRTLDRLLDGRSAQVVMEEALRSLNTKGLTALAPVGEKVLASSFSRAVDNFVRTGRPTNTILHFMSFLKIGKDLQLKADARRNYESVFQPERGLFYDDQSAETEEPTEEHKKTGTIVGPDGIVLSFTDAVDAAIVLLNLAFLPLLLLSNDQTKTKAVQAITNPIVHFETTLTWTKAETAARASNKRAPRVRDMMLRISDSILSATRFGSPMEDEPKLLSFEKMERTGRVLFVVQIMTSVSLDELASLLREAFPTRTLVTGFRIFFRTDGLMTGREVG